MRGLIALVAAAAAVVCQLTIVDRIAFPGGAGPDLVLVLVAALALASGPLAGALIGFWAGLALDVAPPGSHFTGQNALVFCLVGYACGLLADEPSGDGVTEQGHTALFEIVVVAAGAIFGEALAVLLGVMLSDPRVTWSAITHVLPVAAAYDAVAGPFVLFAAAAALRLAGASYSRGEGSAYGQGAGGRPAPRREPRLKLGRGLTAAGGAGATFSAGGSVSGPAKVRFAGRRREGVLGGSLSRGSLPRGSLSRGSLSRGSVASSGPAGTRMGRSLLGGSVFSRPSPALARTSTQVPPGRTTLLGRSLAPRFSRGKALTRLTGAMRRSARPRSPGRGWLRRTSPRSSALGRGALGGGRGALGRRPLSRGALKSGAFKGGTALGRGSLAGTRGLRAGGPARLRMPRRKTPKAWKRSWRTGGYR